MNKYDCIVIGGGWGGMAFALLNAMTGKKTAIIERHDRLGGYGHCFEKSGYRFCANMHYFFETQPGGTVDKFLKRIKLDQEVTFNCLDKDGFDVIRVNDFSFKIPSGIANYQQKLLQQFPENTDAINRIFIIREHLEAFANSFFDKNIPLWKITKEHPSELIDFIRYSLRSSCSILDNLNIHDHLRTILLSRLGNLGLTSKDAPLLMLLLEMTSYTNCAAYPAKGMHHFINKVSDRLKEYNVDIFLNTEIVNIKHQQHRAISATDQNGNEFNADMFVSDMDPQMTFELCNIPPTKKYDYQYTYSCFSLFLGLKNIKLSDYSLGNFNVWYYPDDNLDEDCELVLRDLDYSKSYLFISTPSAHVDPGVLSPEGSQTMQVVVPASYEAIVKLYNDSPSDYAAIKEKIKNEILDTLSAKFIPDIRQYIDVIEFWSPLDLSNKVKTPCGALYGMRPDVRKLVWPVGHNSPLKNLYFVGATSSYAGLGPVINGAMKLFDELHSENRVTS